MAIVPFMHLSSFLSAGLALLHPRRWQWPSVRSLRWCSGWVLLVYVTLHLLNHVMGLVSLSSAEAMRSAVHGLWHSVLGTILLYGALLTHASLAWLAVAQRRTWRMPVAEAVRLACGLGLPLLMAAHFASTRWATSAWDVANSYERVVASLWNPWGATLQLSLLTVAWLHGCMGLHFAWRARTAWQRNQPLLLTAAVLLPVLAVLGLLAIGREINAAQAVVQPAPALVSHSVQAVKWGLRWGWLVLLALALSLPWLLRQWQRRQQAVQQIRLHYPGRSVQVPVGWSVLEASRAHGIAHLSLCGGRARCSTCRVRVHSGATPLPAPSRDERATLARVHAPADVRLACQLRPTSDLHITPLFSDRRSVPITAQGHEQEVVVLFVDLRQWSVLSERQWPVDLSWVLDRYFALVGRAVQDSGGVANQFIGDSVMAIFGRDTDLPTAAHQALQAAARIDTQMQAWGTTFAEQFGQRLDFGMGLHAGSVLLARVGFADNTTFTAVGEVVNTASRLQEYSKVAQARLVLSAHVAQLAQVHTQLGTAQSVQVRGRSEALEIYHVAQPSLHWPPNVDPREAIPEPLPTSAA